MEIYSDIKTGKLFFCSQRIQFRQTCALFCTSKLIRILIWGNRLFMPPLRLIPTLQPCLKFCSKQASYFDRHARLITKHSLLQYSFTATVTEYQKSAYGCFPLVKLNLDLWDGNRCFADRLLKYLVPTVTKEFK